MSGVQLSMRVRNAALVAKHLEDFDSEVKQISAGRIYGRMAGARVRLTRAPAPYAGQPPHQWASEKQRRYVMWAIRQGIIRVPYQRTGRYQSGWKVEKLENGTGYRLRNAWAKAKYVSGNAYGQGQYHIHVGRWPELRATVEEVQKGLPQEIRGDIAMVARRRGFRR